MGSGTSILGSGTPKLSPGTQIWDLGSFNILNGSSNLAASHEGATRLDAGGVQLDCVALYSMFEAFGGGEGDV